MKRIMQHLRSNSGTADPFPVIAITMIVVIIVAVVKIL